MGASVEKLQQARDWLARTNGWCQGVYAEYVGEDDMFVETEFDDRRACRFCPLGALQIEECEGSPEIDLLEWLVDGTRIAKWNDVRGRTQAEVVGLFDRAIALAKAEATS